MGAALRTGVVSEFDERVGLGVVRADDGDDVAFHCTAISDGTRTIDVGTRVAFSPVAGHRGTTEVHLCLRGPAGDNTLRLGDGFRVTPSAALMADLKALVGSNAVSVS